MKHLVLPTTSIAVVAALLAACSGANTAGSGSTGSSSGGSDGSGGGTGGSLQAEGGSTSETTIGVTVGTASTGSGSGTDCDSADDEDRDQDGFTREGGDCNDCDANVNPDAIEVMITEPDPETGMVPEPADEDCDDFVDNVAPATCDQDLALATGNALDGARAMELCQQAPEQGGWGVISARWVRPAGGAWSENPAPGAKVGILENFGPNVPPQGGARVLGMSSGYARLWGQDGQCGTQTCQTNGGGQPPPGFPSNVPGCPSTSTINDDVGLEVRLRAPSNATGFSFDFRFATFEYPEWVCDIYNDQFVAIMDPAPPGSLNGNVSFDSLGNPVSVNIGFFDVCTGCAAGPDGLVGTGFAEWASPGDAGGTSWLRSTVPVTPGQELTIRFVIWDAGDSALDSTSVIDNFQWIANGGTVEIGTGEAPPPN